MGDLRVDGRVTLDQGHVNGCSNIGYSGVYNEGNGNFDFVAGVVEKTRGKVDVAVTRGATDNPSLTTRARIAAKYGKDCFISVHSDAFSNPTSGGCTVYYSVDISEDKQYAEELGQAVANAYGVKFRGAKVKESTIEEDEDYYTVMDAAQDLGIRHVFLIERAFHSNPNEEKKLLDPILNDRAEQAVANWLIRHFGEEVKVVMTRDFVKKKEPLGTGGFAYIETITDNNDPAYKRIVLHNTDETYLSIKEESGTGTIEIYAKGKGSITLL